MSFISHRGRESLLDLGLVSKSLTIIDSTVLVTDLSDHYACYSDIMLDVKRQRRKLVQCRNFKKALPLFQSAGMTLDGPLINDILTNPNDPSRQAETIENWVLNIVDTCAPEKTHRVRPGSPLWLTPDLKRLVAAKNKFFRRLCSMRRLYPNQNFPSATIRQYKKFRNHVKSKLQKSKRDYYSQGLSADTSNFYKYANMLMGKSP